MMNDEQAIKGLKELDRQVIGAIYDQYFSEVYRYVQYRIGNPAHAEDIASEVSLRLLEASQAGKGPQSNLKGWLIATASHVVMDQFRGKYRRISQNPTPLPTAALTLQLAAHGTYPLTTIQSKAGRRVTLMSILGIIFC